MQKVLCLIFFFGFFIHLKAQTLDPSVNVERSGLTFGTSIGAGVLHLSSQNSAENKFVSSFPNLRIGYLLNNRLAFQLLIPGSIYSDLGETRANEGICISTQYWLKNKWWILGGIGIGMDAPAFWTVTDPSNADFNFGFPALTTATGYELWRKKNFVLDIQYRIFAGEVDLEDGTRRKGISNIISLGFNWH